MCYHITEHIRCGSSPIELNFVQVFGAHGSRELAQGEEQDEVLNGMESGPQFEVDIWHFARVYKSE